MRNLVVFNGHHLTSFLAVSSSRLVLMTISSILPRVDCSGYGRCLRLQRCVIVISNDAPRLSDNDNACVVKRSAAGLEVRESEPGCTDRSRVTRTERSDVRHWSITRNGRWVLRQIADLFIDDKHRSPSKLSRTKLCLISEITRLFPGEIAVVVRKWALCCRIFGHY